MGLLRTIAIIIIVYYVFTFLSRIFLPIFFKKVVENVEKKYKEQQNQQHQTTKGKVGETVIDKKPNLKESSNEVGEYVDYEEIKDDKN
ncbi:DUF4834 family protein [Lutibacter sp.]|uniref:DUF4834 family protein n=1 Tax=Lutibacter sp. TaxID=1925666 RepID=UPI0027324EBF|nr:DUF4834 family protein [Lutibacter sp.]MDP3314220.1 DUF4834 family protein [Lutibacter sp.]